MTPYERTRVFAADVLQLQRMASTDRNRPVHKRIRDVWLYGGIEYNGFLLSEHSVTLLLPVPYLIHTQHDVDAAGWRFQLGITVTFQKLILGTKQPQSVNYISYFCSAGFSSNVGFNLQSSRKTLVAKACP